MSECINGGDSYWETYFPVVNILSVRIILAIAKLHNLDSKAIDSVHAFPHADLEEDICVYLPIVFQVNSHTKAGSERSFLLKLNKKLYGLKQGSYNWYKELKNSHVNQGFKPSYIDRYLYIGIGLIVLTYVENCIIVGPSMENINRFCRFNEEQGRKLRIDQQGRY